MEFRQKVKEPLGYYVYALVDPRNSKIFYIGKGKENRVFQHAKGALEDILEDALSENAPNLKLDTIRSIISEGKRLPITLFVTILRKKKHI